MSAALIYIRQSRNKADQRTVSPEVQEEACRALLAVRACSEVIVYRDLDLSGGLPPEQRPGFMALHQRIRAADKKHERLVVATYNQSRLSRNNADSATFYAFIENRLWVDLVMVDGRFDRSPSGELTWTVMAAAATHLRKSTAKNIRDAYAHMNADGKATGMPPYGYRWWGSPVRREGWEHDPERAEVVRLIFSRYGTTGPSSRLLARLLRDENHPPPAQRGNGAKGEWLPDTVVGILRNPAYAGLKYPDRQSRLAHDTSKLIVAQWEPIIDQPTWYRVQKLMDGARPPGRKTSEPKEYVFQGLLWCRDCGQPMRATTVYGIAYYHCRRDTADRCLTATHSIREDRMRPWADYLFGKMSGLQPADFADAIRAVTSDDRVGAVDAIRKLEEQQKRVAHRYELGHIAEDAYKARWEELERLKEQWKVAPTTEQKVPSLPIASLSTGWSLASPRQKRDLLGLLFDKLWVRRTPDNKWEAEHGQQVDVIDSFVPRSDYPVEVISLVGLVVAPGTHVMFDMPAIPRPGRPTLVGSGKGGIRTLEGALHPLPA
jgi:DNA invertase Pin-like site-specific DNA recombinase